jgi:hypothetical protein
VPPTFHVSTTPTSRQYSDSTSNLRLRPRLPINTSQMIKEVLRQALELRPY